MVLSGISMPTWYIKCIGFIAPSY